MSNSPHICEQREAILAKFLVVGHNHYRIEKRIHGALQRSKGLQIASKIPRIKQRFGFAGRCLQALKKRNLGRFLEC
jgi:hypothetical protein